MAKKRNTSAKNTTTLPAPFIDKLLAVIIDCVIVVPLVMFPIGFLLRRISVAAVDFDHWVRILEDNPQLMLSMTIVSIAIILLIGFYFVLFEYRLGSTPGKRIFGLEVAGKRKNKKPVLWRVIVRNLNVIFLFSALTLILVIIDMLSQFGNKERQRLLEKWSDTRVIKRIVV
jgi:uncharacterized RDD family membrane protein YckC